VQAPDEPFKRIPRQIETGRQLLVEGRGPEGFFKGFLRALGRNDEIQVQDFGGVNELRGFLRALAAAPGFRQVRNIGVVRDAEQDVDAAFRSVAGALDDAGLPSPPGPGVSNEGTPVVRVYILPDCKGSGMLETLLQRSVEELPTWRCVEELFRCVDEVSQESIRNPDKARIAAYLATRPRVVSVGVAAQIGYWDWDHAALAPLRAFLEAL